MTNSKGRRKKGARRQEQDLGKRGGGQVDSPRSSFEVEEEFDPSLLGFHPDDEITKDRNGENLDSKDQVEWIRMEKRGYVGIVPHQVKRKIESGNGRLERSQKVEYNDINGNVNTIATRQINEESTGSVITANDVLSNDEDLTSLQRQKTPGCAETGDEFPRIPSPERLVEENDPTEQALLIPLPEPTSPNPSPALSTGILSTISSIEATSISNSSSISTEDKPTTIMKSQNFNISIIKTRIPGTRRTRPAIRITRPKTPKPPRYRNKSQSRSSSSPPSLPEPEPDPPPPSQNQSRILQIFGKPTLKQIHHFAKLHNTTGTLLPHQLRDLFPALSDMKMTVNMANDIRENLGLPKISSRRSDSDKLGLKRVVALMREYLYGEIMAALLLAEAPAPLKGNADQDKNAAETERRTDDVNGKKEGEEKLPKIILTPLSLENMMERLPKIFPGDKSTLKSFMLDQKAAMGEAGKVIWERGVGRMANTNSKTGVGFRGKIFDEESSIHVFVDYSNILHGLLHHLYTSPSTALPPRHLRTLSLPCLSLLLRRGRPTPPGSLQIVASSPLFQNLDPLVKLGYEVSILKRIEVYEDEILDSTSSKLQSKTQNHISVGMEEKYGSGTRRYREQAVDEILCLKALQAINRKGFGFGVGKVGKGCTNTLVLATGDARGGQFNREGFLGVVKEALKRGWNVELWSWSQGLSRMWAETARKEGWGREFGIHLLDEWAEQLVEVQYDDDEDDDEE